MGLARHHQDDANQIPDRHGLDKDANRLCAPVVPEALHVKANIIDRKDHQVGNVEDGGVPVPMEPRPHQREVRDRQEVRKRVVQARAVDPAGLDADGLRDAGDGRGRRRQLGERQRRVVEEEDVAHEARRHRLREVGPAVDQQLQDGLVGQPGVPGRHDGLGGGPPQHGAQGVVPRGRMGSGAARAFPLQVCHAGARYVEEPDLHGLGDEAAEILVVVCFGGHSRLDAEEIPRPGIRFSCGARRRLLGPEPFEESAVGGKGIGE